MKPLDKQAARIILKGYLKKPEIPTSSRRLYIYTKYLERFLLVYYKLEMNLQEGLH